MKDQLVTFETAKLAKEKGFDWECLQFWEYDKKHKEYYRVFTKDRNYLNKEDIKLPTQSLLQKWLREEHDIKVCVSWVKEKLYNTTQYVYEINHDEYSVGGYKIYEEALERGLNEALKLI